MASNYEKPPVFSKNRLWTEKDLKSLEKAKFQGNHMKAEVPIYGGKYGMEYFLSKTRPSFLQAATRLNWSWTQTFDEFENVLDGAPRTAWHEVLHSLPLLDRELEESFDTATNALVKKLLNNNTPRDQQWIYLQPGGDHAFYKDLMTPPVEWARGFHEMVRISQLLPAGNIADPSDALQVQWLYMSYHPTDRAKYVESGKVLDDETSHTLTAYFQAIYDQNVADGTLRRQELQRNASRTNSDKHRRRDNDNNNSRSTSRSSRDRHRDRNDRDHDRCRSRDSKRARDDRRPRDRERNGSDRACPSDNKSSSSRATKPAVADPCPEHSRDGREAKHTWAECSRNPANKKAPERRDTRRENDHHHADARYVGSDDDRSYGNNTPEPSDDESSRRSGSDFSDDNFAVYDEPRKSFPRGKPASKRHKAASYQEYDYGDENYAATSQSPRDETNPLDF